MQMETTFAILSTVNRTEVDGVQERHYQGQEDFVETGIWLRQHVRLMSLQIRQKSECHGSRKGRLRRPHEENIGQILSGVFKQFHDRVMVLGSSEGSILLQQLLFLQLK